MTNQAIHFGTVLMAFFAIMNPIANAPLFLSLTDDMDKHTRRGVALRSVLLAFLIVTAFAISGRAIFSVFGITLPAFRIAGGVLVALVGYHMLHGESSKVHTPTAEDNELSQDAAFSIAVTPLAMPILAGPGTIATAMNYAAQSTLSGVILVVAAFAIICFLTWVAFVGSEPVVRFLGQNAIKVVSRLMGLILTVIGAQMLIEGVRAAFTIGSSL